MSGIFTFYDGLQSSPKKVSLEITAEVLVLRLQKDNAVLRIWYWQDVRVTNWPSGGVPGVLSHIKETDARLVIPAEEWPRISKENPILKSGDPFRKAGFFVSLGAAGILVTAALVLGAPLLLDIAARAAPLEWENKIGEAFSQDISSAPMCKANAVADKAMIRFLRQIGDPHSDYKISVIRDSEENAFTAPGQRILILSGFLKSVQTQDELAGVLAHEAGHIHYHHSFRALVRSAGFSLLLSLLAGNDTTWAANSVYQLFELKNDRSFESQADNYAALVLKRENINPDGLSEFLLRREGKEKDAPALEWLSSHPATNARIAFLSHKHGKGTKKSGYQPFSAPEWGEITRYCD